MPIYEYECQQCNHRSEELQRVSDPPLTTCPACGGPYKKLISAPAFQFKGSGWYVTDYARKQEGGGKKEGAAAKEGSGDKAGGGKAEGSKAEGGKEATGKAPASKGEKTGS